MCGIDEAAGGGHEAEGCGGGGIWDVTGGLTPAARLGERTLQSADVLAEDRVEVGVDGGGVATGDDLDERGQAAGRADLGEAGFSREGFDALFVLWIGEGVQEADGERVNA